jgi:uncharacterized ParB-like nuclease family protein
VPVDSPQSTQSSSTTVSRMDNNAAPTSAWAKPAVEVNMVAVDGQVTGYARSGRHRWSDFA